MKKSNGREADGLDRWTQRSLSDLSEEVCPLRCDEKATEMPSFTFSTSGHRLATGDLVGKAQEEADYAVGAAGVTEVDRGK